MPTWGQLILELNALTRATPQIVPGRPSPHDQLRHKYLTALSAHTGRAVIVYATSWLESVPAPPESIQIGLGDVQALMECCSNVTERELDLVVTSPGGSAEAAESMVAYLRTRFDHIRVIVPVAAMSAGTMIALAADEVVLGSHSQLGPIDPQITVMTPEGPRTSPAKAIQDQFELAKRECADPANIGAWLPLLRSLLPGLLAYCESAQKFSQEFAERELAAHMLSGKADPAASAKKAADFFTDFGHFNSHGRRISRDDARAVDLNITDLEQDSVLQDLVLSVHHATRLSYQIGVVKLVENHRGKAYIESRVQSQIQLVPGPPPAGPPPMLTPVPLPPAAPSTPGSKPRPGQRPARGNGGRNRPK